MKLAVLAVCAAFMTPTAHAQQSELRHILVRVTDGNNRLTKGVRIRDAVTGVISDPSDQNGLTWILAPAGVSPGQLVLIDVANAGSRHWLLVNPVDGLITVRPFDKDVRNIIPVTVVDRDDPKLLVSGRVLFASAARIVRELPPPQVLAFLSRRQTQAVLAQEAQRLGVRPGELQRALDSWVHRVEDPREKATAALYEQRFQAASALLGPLFEQQTNRTFDVAVDLGFALYSQGLYSDAASRYEIALALRPDDYHVLNDLGAIRTQMAQFKEADSLLDRALKVLLGKLNPNDPEIAATWKNKSELLGILRDFDGARVAIDNAFKLIAGRFGEESPRLIEIYDEYGHLYFDQQKYALAMLNYRKALHLIELDKTGAARLDNAVVLANLASAERDNGELDKSAANLAEALRIADRLIASGSIRKDHPVLGSIHNEYYGLFSRKQEYDKAETEILQARDIWAASLGEAHPSFAIALNNLASNYMATSRPGLALPLLKQVVMLDERARGSDRPVTGRSIQNLASCYLELGRLSEAQPLFEKAIALLDNRVGFEMTLAGVYNNLGGLYIKERKFDLAESHLRKSLQLRDGVENQVVEYTKTLVNLGDLYRDEGRFSEAEVLLQDALRLRQTSSGVGTQSVVEALAHLGGLYFVQQKYAQALPHWKTAYELTSEPASSRSIRVLFAQSMNNLGGLYVKLGRFAEAEPLLKAAHELWPNLGLGEGDGMLRTCEHYAELLTKLGRMVEAELIEAQAKQIRLKLSLRKQ